MEAHFKLTDREFIREFKSGNLKPLEFTHEAHIRLAWIQITTYGIDTALQIIPKQIQSYVSNIGAYDKYNHTLTIAAVKAVYHFMLRSKGNDFKSFILEFPRLKLSFNELMHSHYSIDIFNSEKAKHQYITPDLLAFDL
ncbi:hypothetical protein [Constantimarinum furrinae]|uniref:Uncharacterized protein n=1 Tax=Constantimarinum furrinae TaxID=2562285 RepID=A0A7G8PVH3_9FLAO|nr:hypothetical protein [Constantimarinum furrinae]QNJ98339.1 hypothetical protein ALE3EI_1790 [Constantimarinum furrinae]